VTQQPRGEQARALPCRRCGALNGADFGTCIRCGSSLVQARHLEGPLDGRSLLATKMLGGLTFLVFAGQIMAALARNLGLFSKWNVVDYLRSGALLVTPELRFEPFRLLSAVFVHFGLIHFGMNMLALSNLARIAEPAVGSARFVIAYVVTGVLGFATTALWGTYVKPEEVFTAGASGAVFGVMGLILGWLLRRRDPRWKHFAFQAVFYSVVFGFLVNASNTGIRINNSAHLGGLVSGVLFGLFYANRGRGRHEGLVNAGALASLAACVAALALAQRSPL
jgi:rhomboid protease GluP